MKTFRYFLTIALTLLVLTSKAEEKDKAPKAERHLHNTGLRLGFNLASPFQSLWTKGDRYGAEFSADAEIKPDLFLAAEAGWENFEMDQDYVDFSSSGAFLRLGVDYNLLHVSNQPQDKSSLYIGLRYGLGGTNQTVNSYTINNYWGDATGSIGKESYFSQWGEFVLGMKAEVLKNIFLGWDVRVKFLVSQQDIGTPSPYFVAGYGAGDGAQFGFSYSIIYSIPFKFGSKKQVPAEQ